jgi:hypothetical protein
LNRIQAHRETIDGSIKKAQCPDAVAIIQLIGFEIAMVFMKAKVIREEVNVKLRLNMNREVR